jgi:hypothetical protein
MKQLISILSLTLFLCSCGQKDSKQKETGQNDTDKVANKTEPIDTGSKQKEPEQNPNPVTDPKLITGNSAGPVKIGMTLAQLKDAVKSPLALGKEEEGFEGDKYYPVNEGNSMVMKVLVYADLLRSIVISDKNFHTADSVHIGMLLSDIEKKYGKLSSIDIDEQDDFESADFTNHPGISFRIAVKQKGKRAGIYAKDEFSATKYNPVAYVYAIMIETPN